jgi:hypothetical protein
MKVIEDIIEKYGSVDYRKIEIQTHKEPIKKVNDGFFKIKDFGFVTKTPITKNDLKYLKFEKKQDFLVLNSIIKNIDKYIKINGDKDFIVKIPKEIFNILEKEISVIYELELGKMDIKSVIGIDYEII